MEDRLQKLYDLLDKSVKSKTYKQYKKGDIAEGIIEKIGEGYVIVKIDGVYDAVVSTSELVKIEGKESKIGDKVKVFVLKPEDDFGNMLVSQRRTTASQRWEILEQANKDDQPVVVSVVEVNSGGLIVNADGVVGFIPTSQLDPNKLYKLEGDAESKTSKDFSRRLADLIGSKITTKIMEIDKTKNKVIFSEKLVLNDQSLEMRNQMLQNVKVGDVMEGTVMAVTSYGIFVNANGLDGLVHVSEISWDKVENPADFTKAGDTVRVKLIDLSEGGKRVAYSMKQLTDDPWNEVSDEYKVGGRVRGTVTEVEDYGVIVKIDEGVTGLIHKSELSDGIIGDPKDIVKVGDELEAVILTISPSERKMGLSVKKLNSAKKGSSESKKPSKGKRKVMSGSLDIAGALEKAGISEIEETKKEKKTKK